MSCEAHAWAYRQNCDNVARKAVLMTLAHWADAAGFVKSVSIAHLQQATALSRSSVFTRLRELEVGGALERERGHHDDGRTVSATLNLGGCFTAPADPPSDEIQKTRKARERGIAPERRPVAATRPQPPASDLLPLAPPRAGGELSFSLARLEAQCRILVGSAPAAICADFTPIARLVAEGASEKDVLRGVRAAMSKPGFRPRSWAVFVNFIRRERTRRAAANETPQRPEIKDPLLKAYAKLYAEALEEEAAQGRPGTSGQGRPPESDGRDKPGHDDWHVAPSGQRSSSRLIAPLCRKCRSPFPVLRQPP